MLICDYIAGQHLIFSCLLLLKSETVIATENVTLSHDLITKWLYTLFTGYQQVTDALLIYSSESLVERPRIICGQAGIMWPNYTRGRRLDNVVILC